MRAIATLALEHTAYAGRVTMVIVIGPDARARLWLEHGDQFYLTAETSPHKWWSAMRERAALASAALELRLTMSAARHSEAAGRQACDVALSCLRDERALQFPDEEAA